MKQIFCDRFEQSADRLALDDELMRRLIREDVAEHTGQCGCGESIVMSVQNNGADAALGLTIVTTIVSHPGEEMHRETRHAMLDAYLAG